LNYKYYNYVQTKLPNSIAAIKEELNKQKSAAFGNDTMAEQDWQLDISLVRMLDDVITLYHIAVHKQLSKVSKELYIMGNNSFSSYICSFKYYW
jgi:hypothetical protein